MLKKLWKDWNRKREISYLMNLITFNLPNHFEFEYNTCGPRCGMIVAKFEGGITITFSRFFRADLIEVDLDDKRIADWVSQHNAYSGLMGYNDSAATYYFNKETLKSVIDKLSGYK